MQKIWKRSDFEKGYLNSITENDEKIVGENFDHKPVVSKDYMNLVNM